MRRTTTPELRQTLQRHAKSESPRSRVDDRQESRLCLIDDPSDFASLLRRQPELVLDRRLLKHQWTELLEVLKHELLVPLLPFVGDVLETGDQLFQKFVGLC